MPRLLSRHVVPICCCLLLATAATAQFPPANPPYQAGFPVTFGARDERVIGSSVAYGDVDGAPGVEIVVGTRDGKVQVYRANGSKLWELGTGAEGIDGKAAIGDIDADGANEIVIGAGSTLNASSAGGLFVLQHNPATAQPQLVCSFVPPTGASTLSGVYSSPALADLDGNDGGRLEIVFGSWNFTFYVLHDNCQIAYSRSHVDSIWSSPALGDLDRDGKLEIVIGSDSNAQPMAEFSPEDGGMLFAFEAAPDLPVMPGFPIQLDEVIYSSPALGDLDRDGFLDIVVGTGRCWDVPNCAPFQRTHTIVEGERIWAWNRLGQVLPGWPLNVSDVGGGIGMGQGEYAFASPALADVDGDGDLEVVINTKIKSADFGDFQGRTWVIHGNGQVAAGWPQQPSTPADCNPANNVHFGTASSPIVADVDGDGDMNVITISNTEVVMWSSTGVQLTRTGCPSDNYFMILQHPPASSPAVLDLDGDGDLELVLGGAVSGGGTGAIYAWDFDQDVASSPATLPWPQFRGSSDNWSLAEGPLFSDGFESGNASAWSDCRSSGASCS